MPHVIFSYYRVRKTGRKGQAFSANIDYIQQDGMPSCRRCGARDAIFYDHYERKAKLSSIDGKAYDVKIRAKRYRCPHCGHLFREPIRGLKPHKRMSENFKDSVAEKYSGRRHEQAHIGAVESLAKHSGADNPREI